MNLPKPIVYVFEELVQNVSNDILSKLQIAQPKIRAINYQYGHPIEIIETLAQYDKSTSKKFEKYPLVMLVQDFAEDRGKVGEYYGETNLRIVIAHHTKKDYKAEERYEKTFVPILYPIYESLMEEIYNSRYFLVQSLTEVVHTKKDRLYWGRESLNGTDANSFCDYLDAIEIMNLRIKVDNSYCTFLLNP